MPYVCYLCGYRHKRKSNMRSHLKIHTKDSVNMWEIDPRHMTTPLEEEPYEWEPFGKHEVHNMKKSPEKTLAREKLYECELCDYRCNRGSLLKTHMHLHSSRKACRSCSFSSSRTACLPGCRTGEKCGGSDQFSSSKYLTRHLTSLMRRLMKKHETARRCPCDLCVYSSDNAAEHRGGSCKRSTGRKQNRSHPGNSYACGLCDYRCSRSGGLSAHVRTHVSETSDDCDLCYYQSSSSSCDSCDYRSINVKYSRKNTMDLGDEPRNYTSKRNNQARNRDKTLKRDKHYARGLYDYFDQIDMREHNEDSLPYAVVLVTEDPGCW